MEQVYCETVQSGEFRSPSDHITVEDAYNIEMRPELYGYTLNIGCQRLALESEDSALKIINYYLKNKVECIKAYHKGALKDLVKTVLKNKK